MWQLWLNARLHRSALSAHSNPGHFVQMETTLKVPSEMEVSDYHLESAVSDKWASGWSDHRLGANKSQIGSKDNLSSHVWTRMVNNPRLIHTAGDRW